MFIYKVGVVGAGTMGAQIAQVVSFAGVPVVLADVDEAAAQRGLQIARGIYQARVDKGKMTALQLEEKMLLVTVASDLKTLADVDLVIEAIPEDLKLKRDLFQELDRICSPSAILASNTSALSISALGACSSRPGRVLGLHFFNPAYAMPLVEVIPGLATDPHTVDDAVGFAEGVRKVPIVVKDCAGFLVNRLLMPYLNEAVFCVQEGATPKEIDREMVAFGMPVGPCTLLDSLGVDICLYVARILHESYGPRMAPAPLLEAMFSAGYVGVKSGRGFYDYHGNGEQHLEDLVLNVRKETGARQASRSGSRLLLPMVNEAAHALQEGIASARDIDLAMLMGTGFPKEKEGPLHFADQLGLDQVQHELDGLSSTLGTRFWPAPILRRLVDAGFTGKQPGRGFFQYSTSPEG